MKELLRIKLVFVFVLTYLIAGTAQADMFEKVLSSGKLKVGVSLFEPWAMQDKNGNLNGFEIQVARKLADDLGVKAEFKVVDWENIIDMLENKEVDIIIAGMAITPKRALRLNFSIPYASSGIGLVANLEKTKDINSVGELNTNKSKIGAVSGTVAEGLKKKVFYKAAQSSFVSNEEAINAVVSGEIHALVASSPTPKFVELTYPKKVDVPLNKPLLSYKTGMAVNIGEQKFLNYLNAWITAKKAEGWLNTNYDYWFNSLRWRKE